jgi:hypothetical protein
MAFAEIRSMRRDALGYAPCGRISLTGLMFEPDTRLQPSKFSDGFDLLRRIASY